MTPLIRKLRLWTLGVALMLLLAVGIFPLGSFPLLGLAGVGWLVIGGIITLICLIWAFRKKWWKELGLHFLNVILAAISIVMGITELGATGVLGQSYLSSSLSRIIRVNGLGDSGTSPYVVQMKWTMLPFFSISGTTVFSGDCDGINLEWSNSTELHITCRDMANVTVQRSEVLGVSVKYDTNAREQTPRFDSR